MKDDDLNKAKEYLNEWRSYCYEGRATSSESAQALMNFRNMLNRYGLEFCAHNAAILGSKEYERYKFKGIDRLISCLEYEALILRENE